MNFVYTAMNRQGQRISDGLECANLGEARQTLAERGLFVLKINAGASSDASSARRRVPRLRIGRNVGGNLALFARQMNMMQHSGAPVVPALRAISEQTPPSEWRSVLTSLSDDVEGGASLKEAMSRYPQYFGGTFRSIIDAGETTGTLTESFERLSTLLDAHQKTRRKLLGSLSYPCMLVLMVAGVLGVMSLFVLPRFKDLFAMLDADLPLITTLMIDASAVLVHWWPLVVFTPIAGVTAVVLWCRSGTGRQTISRLAVNVPGVRGVVRGVILANILRTWSSLLCSKVPLLDSVRQAREATDNASYRALIADVATAVNEGREIATVFNVSPLVPATVAAAVATGEQTGKLGEAMEFVATWLEEENQTRIESLTRLLEPLILIMMGVVVGGVCVALFLPLFDIATAA